MARRPSDADPSLAPLVLSDRLAAAHQPGAVREARGRCEQCGRRHGETVAHLGDGRWWDTATPRIHVNVGLLRVLLNRYSSVHVLRLSSAPSPC